MPVKKKGGSAATERLADHSDPLAKRSQSEPKEPDLRPHPNAGRREQHGRLCTDHLKRVQELVGTRDCAWPGCLRQAWDRAGACSFHRQVCWGLIED